MNKIRNIVFTKLHLILLLGQHVDGPRGDILNVPDHVDGDIDVATD